MRLRAGEQAAEVRLDGETASIDGRPVDFRAAEAGGELEALELSGRWIRARVAREGGRAFVWCDGATWEIQKSSTRMGRAAEHPGGLLAPMPGRVRRTLVAEGEPVRKGQVVVILEAMKMEHAIRAPRDGVVRRMAHQEGELVEAGVALVEIT